MSGSTTSLAMGGASGGALPAGCAVNGSAGGGGAGGGGDKPKRKLFDRMEGFVARLTSRSTFWHRVASLIWLPYAFRSGIKIKKVGDNTFSAVLPFRRFNRNWYNAMAGASLLANAEIAGGMYIYGSVGADYTCVCKELRRYRFLRPCFGPAIYRITPRQNLQELIAAGGEFNIELDMVVVQQLPVRGRHREVRVGDCEITFHLTPKALHEARAARRERAKQIAREEAAGGGGGSSPSPAAAAPEGAGPRIDGGGVMAGEG